MHKFTNNFYATLHTLRKFMTNFYAILHTSRKFMNNFCITLHSSRKFMTNYLVIARLKKEEPDFFCWTEMNRISEIKSHCNIYMLFWCNNAVLITLFCCKLGHFKAFTLFFANRVMSRFTRFCVKFLLPKQRSRKSFDKYHVCYHVVFTR